MSTKANPSSTVLITAATGSLGSALVRALTALYPGRFKLLLTCRNTEDARAAALHDSLDLGSADFFLEKLDLSNLQSVKWFTESVKSRVSKGDLPSFKGGGIVNCAAYLNFSPGAKIQQEIYSTNTLGPTLLIRELLPSLTAGEHVTVINIGTSAHSSGRLDHFHRVGEMSALEGPLGYGSSKLLLMMITYAFQRKVYAVRLHVPAHGAKVGRWTDELNSTILKPLSNS
jgi:NAD(P)-dependent dehydrogenase (short-subunit alcohol dehydrogenase family)